MDEEELRRYFAGRLPHRLAEIEAALATARAAAWTGEPLRSAHRLAHSLKGSGATFGFPEVSEAARVLERLLAGDDAGDREEEIQGAWERLRKA